jgi:sulfate adenylyltransferase subunit 1
VHTFTSFPPDFDAFLERNLNKDILRFTTAGSVDDGKSTLIGRLLHDSKAVYEDQLASVKKSGINRSSGPIDFSLLTDGLRAEREQGITIDVAYRYFATSQRKFIIADTPGHEQYTRNMATGASTADLAIILIDGTKGVLSQTRRHASIASLLEISNVVAAVNKMDLVEFREGAFAALEKDFLALAGKLGIQNVQCIPISALDGDNVVECSRRTPWYQGPTLLQHLETVPLPKGNSQAAFRFPVQTVIRPDSVFRGFAGRIASGSVRPGDSVLALPSGRESRVRSIVTYDGDLHEASAGMSITLQLEDEIDLSRGEMLVSPQNPPQASSNFRATVVWLHQTPLEVGRTYLVKHTVRQTKIRAVRIRHRIDINTLTEAPAAQLEMNDIASLEFQTHLPLFFDAYKTNRATGSFVLIDPISNATVGAGMIQEPSTSEQVSTLDSTLFGHAVADLERYERNGHYPALIALSGRAALAQRLERLLFDRGFQTVHLAGTSFRPDELSSMLQVARAAGLIVLLSANGLDATAVQQAGKGLDRFLNLPDGISIADEDASKQVLAFAESLRPLVPRKQREEED